MNNTDKIKKQLKAKEQQLSASNQQLIASEKEIKHTAHDLVERVKELNCLFNISESVHNRDALEDILQDVADIIPPSWQYPEITCAKLTLQNREFKTKNYKESKWRQSSDILSKENIVGEIEVCYLEQCPESDIGPFLKEEERLLYNIAERVGRVIELNNAENELLASNQQLSASEQQLRSANQQLSASEQQLLASNQQLSASEQQLRSANQQLSASEQQLLASNQQLSASEQQLRSANQQLTASEQQLRAANQQLSKSEQRFRELFDASFDGYIIALGSGEVLDANPSMCKMLGYSLDELKTKDWRKFTPEKWLEQELSVQGALILERGYTDLYEKEYIRKDGTIFPIEIQAYTMEKGKDFDSNVNGSFIRDITEHKRAKNKLLAYNQQLTASEQQLRASNQQLTASEQHLRASNQQLTASEQHLRASNQQLTASELKYSLLFNNMNAGFAFHEMIYDINGEPCDYRFLQVNPAFERMTGLKADKIIGKTIKEISPNIESYWIENYAKVAQTGKSDTYENYARELDKHFNVLAFSPKKDFFAVTVLDVTERKRAEYALLASEIKNQSLLDNSPVCTKIVDLDFNLQYMSVAGVNSLKIDDITKLYGKPYPVHFYPAPFNTLMTEKFKKVKETCEIIKLETPVFDANGNILWYQTTFVPVYDNKKQLDYIMIVSLETTERKRAEDDLKAALTKAQESDRLKSAFLANMSHEIRTPMNGILGFIDLLDTPGLEETKKHEFTKIIHKSSERLLNTINELIDISTIEASQVKIINSDVCINKLFDELYVFFTPETKSKGLSLTFLPSHDKNQTTIFTDAHKLNGILMNLIKNAIKYTDTGSITYGYVLKDDFVEFYIEDTGIGIATDRQGAIFDRFVQADIGDIRAFEGLGLGLSISKAYIEAMDGQIWVRSEEGKGSKFIFTIPYKPKKEKQLEPDLDTGKEIYAEDICKNMNILIADDDDVVALYYAESLKNKFRKIHYAVDGKEAIEMFKDNPEIDLILMDAKMPVMDGYKATREIRKFNEDVIIIAQTAYALKGDREKTSQAGCNDYISKPINVEKLMKMIGQLMKEKK